MADCARARIGSSPLASLTRSSARRLAATAPRPVWFPAACFNASTADLSAATLSASTGGFLLGSGHRMGSSTVASWRIAASLGCWSLGMKFSMVLTLDTSGTLESFSTSAWAASLFGASTKIELAPMAGSLRNSRNVATDSTRGFLRLSGLKSNCSQYSSGRPPATTRPVPTIIGIRCRSINRVDRRQAVETHFFRLTRRPQDSEQRWNQRDAGQECDDHAEACKQAQLG